MLDLAPDLTQAAGWMPIVFLVVMGLAMLAYVILDGYDLGVGVLMQRASDDDKDAMIASIGPFWDANETWLVLGVGILLTVFPLAHGVILGDLYLPVALMLIGLTLRGVAFDFRVKARAARKPLWNRAFYAGSLLASWSDLAGCYCTRGDGRDSAGSRGGAAHDRGLHRIFLPCVLGQEHGAEVLKCG